MFEYKGIPMGNIPVPAEKVDLFHFDPFNPDGHCRCGHDGNHGCRKCCHKHESNANEASQWFYIVWRLLWIKCFPDKLLFCCVQGYKTITLTQIQKRRHCPPNACASVFSHQWYRIFLIGMFMSLAFSNGSTSTAALLNRLWPGPVTMSHWTYDSPGNSVVR